MNWEHVAGVDVDLCSGLSDRFLCDGYFLFSGCVWSDFVILYLHSTLPTLYRYGGPAGRLHQ